MRKILKSGFSFLLAFTLILTPSTFTFAKTLDGAGSSQAGAGTAVSSFSTETSANYDAAGKLAQEKADLFTSTYGVTSVQYALIDNGKVVLSGVSGVNSKVEKTVPTNETMYGIGSVSKMFTTAAVMQLVDQGKVSLDTPVVQYIPEFTMADARYKNITVRMLLNHSSGLMGSTLSNSLLVDDNDSTTYKNFLKILKSQRLKADPGAFSVYCNDGFTLAQLLVEKVSGISFSEYIQKNISNPLHLNHTKTPMDEFPREQLAKTYYGEFKNAVPAENLNAIGAGGIYSTAEDLCHFAEVFMNSTKSEVLSGTSARAMEKPEYQNGLWPKGEDTVLEYGLGWDCVNTYPFNQYGIKAVLKGGDTRLSHGSLLVLPQENMAMAILSSGGSSQFNQILAQEVLLSALLTKGSISEIKPDKTFSKPNKTSISDSQKKYEGIYAALGTIFEVAMHEEGNLTIKDLYIEDEAEAEQEFIYAGDGKFYIEDGSGYISFVEEKNGNTYLYASLYSQLPGVGQTASYGYQAQKLTDNPISNEIKEAWEKREDKLYFLVNEKYSSQFYFIPLVMSKIMLTKELEGYLHNNAIEDENNARQLFQIPGQLGRDLTDIHFYSSNHTEYMKNGEYICISEDAVNPIPTKNSFSFKIGAKGYAQWYRIDKKTKNKKIKVTLPQKASYSIYDEKGACTYCSLISDPGSVKLPAGGYIVFAGDANAVFKVKYVK